MKTYVVTPHKNRLSETVLMMGHKIFGQRDGSNDGSQHMCQRDGSNDGSQHMCERIGMESYP